MTFNKKLFIIAGEASGEIIGANLVRALQPEGCEIRCVGGELMEKEGAKVVLHYQNLSVMGLFEVLPSYFKLRKHMYDIIQEIAEYKPDLIITIDSPGFNFRLIKSLRKLLSFKAIHYVAPSVWAYAEKRVKTVENLYDHILLILPFEAAYFHNMPHTFVGHPIVEDKTCLLNHSSDEVLARDEKKFQNNVLHISVMPGSRRGEIKRHMKTLVEWMELMQQSHEKKIFFHFLTLPHLEEFLKDEISHYTRDLEAVHISGDPQEHNQIIQDSVLGVVKAGTATTRFMANATPAITFYRVLELTAWIMRMRLQINHFNLCNIITNTNVLPELIQDNFTAQNLLDRSKELLCQSRSKIMDCYLQTWQLLFQDEQPSEKAKKVILKYLA